MLVYRIEHKRTKRGPYNHIQDRDTLRQLVGFDHSCCDMNKPAPGILLERVRWREDIRFGHPSTKSLVDWWCVGSNYTNLERLHKAGFRCKIVEAYKAITEYEQCIFFVNRCKTVDILDLRIFPEFSQRVA